MLVYSKSSTSQRILASVDSVALGDVFDKVARELVPEHLIPNTDGAVCYPSIMEDYAASMLVSQYKAPSNRLNETQTHRQYDVWDLSTMSNFLFPCQCTFSNVSHDPSQDMCTNGRQLIKRC